jgi:hypothetical protein
MFISLYPVVVPCEENSFTLAVIFWFYDESFGLAIVKLLFKLFNISGQHPGLGKESVLLGEVLLHREQVFGQQIFASHSVHPRKVICALVWLHPLQQCRDNGTINKPKIPVFFLVQTRPKVTICCNFVNNLVLGEQYVYYQRIFRKIFVF